jgi:anti-sigma B factor antagonist
MTLHEQQHGAVTVYRPEGALSEAAVPPFAAAVRAGAAKSMGRVVVDLSGVPFVDSTGLEALLDLTDLLSRGGRSLKLCCTNKLIQQVLDLVDIAGQFDLFDDANAAVRSFL